MDTSRDEMPHELAISEARANLTELVASVRLLRRCVMLTRRERPQAAIVPVELGNLVREAGGPDIAIELLRQALRSRAS